MLEAGGIVAAGQELELLVHRICQTKEIAKLVRRQGHPVQFIAQRGGVTGITQKIFLQLLGAQHLRQFASRLLPQTGKLGRVGLLALLLQRVQIRLAPLRRPALDIADRLFCPGRQRAENRSVQRRTARVRWIRVITGLPFRPEQRCQQCAPLGFQRLKLFRGGLGDVRIRLGTPPLLFRADDLRRAAAGEKLVHIGDDDVTNCGFRTTDGPKIGNVSGIIGGLNFVPGEILPANHNAGFVGPARICRRRRGRQGVGSCRNGTRNVPPERRHCDVQAERNRKHHASAHGIIVPRTGNSGKLKFDSNQNPSHK